MRRWLRRGYVWAFRSRCRHCDALLAPAGNHFPAWACPKCDRT